MPFPVHSPSLHWHIQVLLLPGGESGAAFAFSVYMPNTGVTEPKLESGELHDQCWKLWLACSERLLSVRGSYSYK